MQLPGTRDYNDGVRVNVEVGVCKRGAWSRKDFQLRR